jgi:transposase
MCRTQPVVIGTLIKEAGFRVTRSLASQVVEMARDIPVKLVASLLGLHWNTVRDIDLTHLKQRIASIDPVVPNSIGVDEIAYQKRHKYLTIVTDQSSRKIIYVTRGRKSENLAEFFKDRIDPIAARWLEAASIDMWDPYEKTIRRYSSHALIVYDKFHLLRMLNDCVDQVRKQAQEGLSREGRRVFRHKRFLLLKGQERLKPEQQQTLDELLEQNHSLHTAYLLKEQFRQLYHIDSDEGDTPAILFRKAFQFLVGWLRRARASGLTPFMPFIRRVKKRWAGILNFFLYPISNGLSEGLNNKIASLKKRAYGFRNLEYFTVKIYQQGGFI